MPRYIQPGQVLRIALHDYSGHPPQVYLSRALARRGHEVLHLYSRDFETPRGPLVRRPDDPPTFHIRPVPVYGRFQKHNYVVRQFQEWAYGFSLTREVMAFAPDIVVCSNTPPVPVVRLQNACRLRGSPFLFWVMDLNSIAITQVFRKRIPLLGPLISGFYDWLEGWELRRSDEVVLISEGFRDTIVRWGVPANRVDTMPLWSALEEIRPAPKLNDWTRQHGLTETVNLIYSGTLGFKHNPELLSGLARAMARRPNVRVIVLSEGIGIRFLVGEKAKGGLDNLILLPFEAYERLPEVLGGADVLLALLEPTAGVYSTPGKVLTHLCAGRAQVAALPQVNRAWKVIQESGGGWTCESGDLEAFIQCIETLVEDPAQREQMGRNARLYAEREFDIDRLAEQFEGYILKARRTRNSGGKDEPSGVLFR